MYCLIMPGFVATNTAGNCPNISSKISSSVATNTAGNSPRVLFKISAFCAKIQLQNIPTVAKMTRIVVLSKWSWTAPPKKKISSYTCHVNVITYCRNVDVIHMNHTELTYPCFAAAYSTFYFVTGLYWGEKKYFSIPGVRQNAVFIPSPPNENA